MCKDCRNQNAVGNETKNMTLTVRLMQEEGDYSPGKGDNSKAGEGIVVVHISGLNIPLQYTLCLCYAIIPYNFLILGSNNPTWY